MLVMCQEHQAEHLRPWVQILAQPEGNLCQFAEAPMSVGLSLTQIEIRLSLQGPCLWSQRMLAESEISFTT